MSHDTPERSTPAEPSAAAALAALPEPSAILFDLDGTLIDTVPTRVAGWVEAFRRYDIPVDLTRLPLYMGSDGRWLAREFATAAGRAMDWAESDEIDKLAGKLFDEKNTDPKPLPGATRILTALESSDLLFCIATASQPAQVAASVNALRLPAPPRIVDAGHVEHAKPEPDLLLAAADQLGVAPADCWYIGDSVWDMMAGVRANMTGVALTTGATDEAGLREAGARVVLAGLGELHAELVRRGLLAE